MAIISTRPTIALVKTRWRKKGPRTLAERAGVIGANVWKVAVEIFRHMEKEGFRFTSDRMVTDVIAECLAFLIQLAERAAQARLPDADRAALIQEVAVHVAHTFENNQRDLFGPHDRTAAVGSGLTDGGRLLSVADPASPPGMATFTEPLRRGGSLVLVRHPDPDRLDGVYDAERATARA